MDSSVQDAAIAAIAVILDAIWLPALVIVAITTVFLLLRKDLEPKFTKKGLIEQERDSGV